MFQQPLNITKFDGQVQFNRSFSSESEYEIFVLNLIFKQILSLKLGLGCWVPTLCIVGNFSTTACNAVDFDVKF